MRQTVKQRKTKSLKSWLDKFQSEYPGIAYKLAGADLEKIAKGMTLEQIEFCLSMTSAGYAVGSETSRKFWSPKYHSMRQQLERATGNKEITYMGLKLVSGERK